MNESLSKALLLQVLLLTIFSFCSGISWLSHSEEFKQNGFIVVRNLFSPARIDELNSQALTNAEELNQLLQDSGMQQRGLEEGLSDEFEYIAGACTNFHEIQSRGSRRYEIHHKMDHSSFNVLLDNQPFQDALFDVFGMDHLTDDEFRLGSDTLKQQSCVFSYPGAGRGDYHIDGGHLFAPSVDKETGATQILPVHAVTVFVPLVDVDESNGILWLLRGSHHWSYKSDAIKFASSHCVGPPLHSSCLLTQFRLERGSAIIMDYRLLHLAGENNSTAVRPVMTFVVARSWFMDTVNRPGPEYSFKAEEMVRSCHYSALDLRNLS
jgi:hypothetical protein